MVVENVSTVLKDIKVTKKGINLTLEDVRLQGEQLQDLASLIGEVVVVGVATPQMDLFEESPVGVPDPSNYTADDVAQELGLA